VQLSKQIDPKPQIPENSHVLLISCLARFVKSTILAQDKLTEQIPIQSSKSASLSANLRL
jgi:hypothetical protein